MPRGKCEFSVMEGQGFGIDKNKEQGLAQKPNIKESFRGEVKELEDTIETKGLEGMVWKSGGTETYGGGVGRYAERGANRKKWKNESPDNKEAIIGRKARGIQREINDLDNKQKIRSERIDDASARLNKVSAESTRAEETLNRGKKIMDDAAEGISKKVNSSGTLKRIAKIGLPIAAAGAVGGYLLHKRNQPEVKELDGGIEIKGVGSSARKVVGEYIEGIPDAARRVGKKAKDIVKNPITQMGAAAFAGSRIGASSGVKREFNKQTETKGGKIPFGASPQTTNPGETYENMPSMSSASAPMTVGNSSNYSNPAYAQGTSNPTPQGSSPTMLASDEPKTITKGRGSAKFAMGNKIQEKGAHPGFQGAAEEVAAKQGIPMKNAEKIIGAGKARASAAARRKNPRLNNTPGHVTKGLVGDILEHGKPLVNLADDVVQVGVRKVKRAVDDPNKKGFVDDDSMIVNKKQIQEKGILPVRSVMRAGTEAAFRGALPGAGVGALTGALGDGEDRLGGAARGAVVGGTLGAVLPAGMAMAQKRRNNAAIKAQATAVRNATGADKDPAKAALRKTLGESKKNIPVETAQMMGGSVGGLGGSYRSKDENQFKGIDSIEEKGVITDAAKAVGKRIKNLGVKEEVKKVANPKKKAGYAPMINSPKMADDPIRIELGNRRLNAYDKPIVLEPNYKGYGDKIEEKSVGSHLLAAGAGALLGATAIGRSGKGSGSQTSSRDEIDYALGKDRLSSNKGGKAQLKKMSVKPVKEKK